MFLYPGLITNNQVEDRVIGIAQDVSSCMSSKSTATCYRELVSNIEVRSATHFANSDSSTKVK